MPACCVCQKDLPPTQELRCPGCGTSYCAEHVRAGPWWYLTHVAEDQYRELTCPRGHSWKEYSGASPEP